MRHGGETTRVAVRHVGEAEGVARRAAHHARQAAEREQVVRILISISIFRTVLVLHQST